MFNKNSNNKNLGINTTLGMRAEQFEELKGYYSEARNYYRDTGQEDVFLAAIALYYGEEKAKEFIQDSNNLPSQKEIKDLQKSENFSDLLFQVQIFNRYSEELEFKRMMDEKDSSISKPNTFEYVAQRSLEKSGLHELLNEGTLITEERFVQAITKSMKSILKNVYDPVFTSHPTSVLTIDYQKAAREFKTSRMSVADFLDKLNNNEEHRIIQEGKRTPEEEVEIALFHVQSLYDNLPEVYGKMRGAYEKVFVDSLPEKYWKTKENLRGFINKQMDEAFLRLTTSMWAGIGDKDGNIIVDIENTRGGYTKCAEAAQKNYRKEAENILHKIDEKWKDPLSLKGTDTYAVKEEINAIIELLDRNIEYGEDTFFLKKVDYKEIENRLSKLLNNEDVLPKTDLREDIQNFHRKVRTFKAGMGRIEYRENGKVLNKTTDILFDEILFSEIKEEFSTQEKQELGIAGNTKFSDLEIDKKYQILRKALASEINLSEKVNKFVEEYKKSDDYDKRNFALTIEREMLALANPNMNMAHVIAENDSATTMLSLEVIKKIAEQSLQSKGIVASRFTQHTIGLFESPEDMKHANKIYKKLLNTPEYIEILYQQMEHFHKFPEYKNGKTLMQVFMAAMSDTTRVGGFFGARNATRQMNKKMTALSVHFSEVLEKGFEFADKAKSNKEEKTSREELAEQIAEQMQDSGISFENETSFANKIFFDEKYRDLAIKLVAYAGGSMTDPMRNGIMGQVTMMEHILQGANDIYTTVQGIDALMFTGITAPITAETSFCGRPSYELQPDKEGQKYIDQLTYEIDEMLFGINEELVNDYEESYFKNEDVDEYLKKAEAAIISVVINASAREKSRPNQGKKQNKEIKLQNTRSITYSEVLSNMRDITGYIASDTYMRLIDAEVGKLIDKEENTIFKNVIIQIDAEKSKGPEEKKAALYNVMFKANRNFRDQMERNAYFSAFTDHQESWNFLFDEEMPDINTLTKMAEHYAESRKNNKDQSTSNDAPDNIKGFAAWKTLQQIEAIRLTYSAFTGEPVPNNLDYQKMREEIINECIPNFRNNFEQFNNIAKYTSAKNRELIEIKKEAERNISKEIETEKNANLLAKTMYLLRKLQAVLKEETCHSPKSSQSNAAHKQWLNDNPDHAKKIENRSNKASDIIKNSIASFIRSNDRENTSRALG